MVNRPQKKNISIQEVLSALLDIQNIFPPTYLHHFTDLEGGDLEALRSVWPQVDASRRFHLLEDLEELADSDTLVNFDNVARLALQDPEPRVRSVAIRLLWEAEDSRLAPVFIKMLKDDPDPGVRAAAASALGKFIYLGELEEIPEDLLHQVESALLDVISMPEEELIRRRALEALGFSGRQEVPPLIREAYDSGDADWLSSALFAMGRSADQAWTPEVKRMLRYPKANVQLEAIRAAGELGIDSSRRILLDLLEEEAQDGEIRAAVVWSLSQIGGEEVRETLEQLLEETEDEEEMGILEDALDNLSFTEDVGLYGMFDPSLMTGDSEDLQELFLTQDDEGYEQGKEDIEKNPGDEDPEKKRNRHRRSST